MLLLLLIHTFSVLFLQLKKLRWANKSAIDLSNANPACLHKEVPRSTGHIVVTTRYSDQFYLNRDPNRDKRTRVIKKVSKDSCYCISYSTIAGRPGSSEVPRNPLTRWDVSSIPANGIFLTKKLKNKIKMPNGWRTIKSLVHKIRLHGRRGKGMAESFSREKLRHAPQKEGG